MVFFWWDPWSPWGSAITTAASKFSASRFMVPGCRENWISQHKMTAWRYEKHWRATVWTDWNSGAVLSGICSGIQLCSWGRLINSQQPAAKFVPWHESSCVVGGWWSISESSVHSAFSNFDCILTLHLNQASITVTTPEPQRVTMTSSDQICIDLHVWWNALHPGRGSIGFLNSLTIFFGAYATSSPCWDSRDSSASSPSGSQRPSPWCCGWLVWV